MRDTVGSTNVRERSSWENRHTRSFCICLCSLWSRQWLSSGGVTCLLVGFVWSQSIKAANHGQKIKNNAPVL